MNPPQKMVLQLTSGFRFHGVAVGETCSGSVGPQLGTRSSKGEEAALQHPHFPKSPHFVEQKDCSHLGELAAASMSDEVVKV